MMKRELQDHLMILMMARLTERRKELASAPKQTGGQKHQRQAGTDPQKLAQELLRQIHLASVRELMVVQMLLLEL
jgi:hypothetical protein